MKQFFIISFFLFSGLYPLNSQTIGLIKHEAGSLNDGYILFAPINATTTYLIDKCGKQVKSWSSAYKAGQSVYLLPNGSLFRTGNVNNTNFVAGGQGGIIEMYDWNGNLTWSYRVSDDTKCQHHDAKVMPNGNVLVIAWELKTNTQAIEQGRNPSLVSTTVWSEQIFEIQPVGQTSGNIVWEWHLWDHLVQDYDSTKPNYDNISTNPQLLNLNFAAKSTVADWIHLNSIDYNPILDQIMLSSHNTSEIWIIDHSTSSEQAASHTGGNSGKGGDFLYRWGNPQAYNIGTNANQSLFGQHNAQWIENDLPYANQILVFNNGVARPGGNYSTVEIINPPVNGHNYTSSLPYLPVSNSWIYNSGDPNNLYANSISGAQQLSNGNVLICNGPTGTFTEINSNGTTLWKYINPVKATGIILQGTTPTQNIVFRCTFYPSNYTGFSGHSLTPGSIIENSNSISENCSLNTYFEEFNKATPFLLYPNPANDYITISGINGLTKIYNTSGAEIWSGIINNNTRIKINDYPNGLYFIRNNLTLNKFIIQK
jgi:hypothetical protein